MAEEKSFKTIEIFPPNLRKDLNIQAFAEILDKVFSKLTEETLEKLFIYAIDNQPEEVLDWLAWQFHIEGWELASSIEEKRALIKSAIELHRYKGTKWAIKKVLEALNLSGDIKEWFEYGGEPYKFKLHIDVNRTLEGDTVLNEKTQEKLLQLVSEYKNERSHLDEFSVGVRFDKKLAITSAMTSLGMMRIECEQPPEREVIFDEKLGIANSMNNIGIIICGSV